MLLLEIWQAWHGGEIAFAGLTSGAGRIPGVLPFSGGFAEQPACVMACLQAMEADYQALRRKPQK